MKSIDSAIFDFRKISSLEVFSKSIRNFQTSICHPRSRPCRVAFAERGWNADLKISSLEVFSKSIGISRDRFAIRVRVRVASRLLNADGMPTNPARGLNPMNFSPRNENTRAIQWFGATRDADTSRDASVRTQWFGANTRRGCRYRRYLRSIF